jgi:hypothetical protein
VINIAVRGRFRCEAAVMMCFGAEIFRDIVRVIEKDLDLGKVANPIAY